MTLLAEQESTNDDATTLGADTPTQRAMRKPVGRRILQQLYKWSVWRVPALACWYWLVALQSRELAIPCLNWIGILAFTPVFRHFLPPLHHISLYRHSGNGKICTSAVSDTSKSISFRYLNYSICTKFLCFSYSALCCSWDSTA